MKGGSILVLLIAAVVTSCSSGVVNGTVYEPSGHPVSGVTVQLVSTYKRYRCETEYDGSYSIRVDPGAYTLSAALRGWHMSQQPRTLRVYAGEFFVKRDIIMVPPAKSPTPTILPIPKIPKYCL